MKKIERLERDIKANKSRLSTMTETNTILQGEMDQIMRLAEYTLRKEG
jgi:hypothetical protein